MVVLVIDGDQSAKRMIETALGDKHINTKHGKMASRA